MPRAAKPKPKPMVITILGCGTSVGVPLIGMQHLPQFKKEKNWRLRASVLVEPFGRGGPAILIDTSPDLREQALRYFPKKPRLDAILLTHTHADHLHGLDDIRPFNFMQKAALPLYGQPGALEEIKVKFSYIFHPLQEGGGVPRLALYPMEKEAVALSACKDPLLHGVEVVPLPLKHGRMETLGFRIGRFAYLTDCSYISDETLEKMRGLEVVVLDCLRPQPHSTHLHVELALDYARRIKARKTVFTHMGHELEYDSFRKTLPRGMVPAYDGMQFKIS
jgi:phosphoribosyl 1,2-cyclic phosphate phosphodiesterase